MLTEEVKLSGDAICVGDCKRIALWRIPLTGAEGAKEKSSLNLSGKRTEWKLPIFGCFYICFIM